MTRFEQAAQSPADMAGYIAFCIAAYLDGSGFHDFSDNNEVLQFMTATSPDIVEWLNGESEDTE